VSAALSVTIDTQAPAAPSTPDLDAASDSGDNTDNITSDNTPTFVGQAEPGSTVTIYSDGVAVGTAIAGADGTYSVTTSGLGDGTHVITASATDAAGNASALSGSQSVVIETVGPTVSIGSPTANAIYQLHGQSAANFSCADSGTGVASCVGTVPSGSYIDTSSVGVKTFTVTATDLAGNVTIKRVSYRVTYRICIDTQVQKGTWKSGSGLVVSVTLRLCDATGNNVSGAAVHRTALDLVSSDATGSLQSLAAAPDTDFVYVQSTNSYRYNVDTAGMADGTWNLAFAVDGDPVAHSLSFKVRSR
jgi:hypothetical protein